MRNRTHKKEYQAFFHKKWAPNLPCKALFYLGPGVSIYLPMWLVHILWLLGIILMTPNVKKSSLLLWGKEVYKPNNGLFWTKKSHCHLNKKEKGTFMISTRSHFQSSKWSLLYEFEFHEISEVYMKWTSPFVHPMNDNKLKSNGDAEQILGLQFTHLGSFCLWKQWLWESNVSDFLFKNP